MLQKKQSNAKDTKALLEKKTAKHVEHMKKGAGIDRVLTEPELDALASVIVEKIKLILPEDHNFYAFVCRIYRLVEEAFASVSGRGNGTRLILDANGGPVTPKDMKDKYRWVVVEDLYIHLCDKRE